ANARVLHHGLGSWITQSRAAGGRPRLSCPQGWLAGDPWLPRRPGPASPQPALLARSLAPLLARRLPALALLRAGAGVVADLEVAQLALEVAEALQAGRVECTRPDRLADGAAGLGAVLAVAELAPPGQPVEILEGAVEPLRRIP